LTEGKSNQLTSIGSVNYQPDVSADKRYIVFVSDRSGSLNIWRMNADGTNQTQLTYGKHEDTPQITPDGKWVVYQSPQSSMDGHIWKVAIDGGEPVRLVTRDAMCPAVSPDGRMLAYVIWDPNIHSSFELQVLSFETGALLKKIALPSAAKRSINKLRWLPDSAGLVFVNDVDGVSNLVVQRLDGTMPKPLTDFRESQIFDFAWSLDSGQLVCVRGNKTSQVVLIKGFRLRDRRVPAGPSTSYIRNGVLHWAQAATSAAKVRMLIKTSCNAS
jgi:Tol biopolymer transport system component